MYDIIDLLIKYSTTIYDITDLSIWYSTMYDIISVHYGASGAPKPAGPRLNSPPRPGQWPGAGRFFFSTLPLPLSRPPPRSMPRTAPLSMNFLRPGPRFFVYSPLEHCSFDTWLSNCVSIYMSLGWMDRTPPWLRELKALCQGAPWCSVHSCQGRVPKTTYLKVYTGIYLHGMIHTIWTGIIHNTDWTSELPSLVTYIVSACHTPNS